MSKKTYSKPVCDSFKIIATKEAFAATRYLNSNDLVDDGIAAYVCNVCVEYLRDIKNRMKGWY